MSLEDVLFWFGYVWALLGFVAGFLTHNLLWAKESKQ